MNNPLKCEFCDAAGNQYYWSCWICGAIECKRQARAIYSLD